MREVACCRQHMLPLGIRAGAGYPLGEVRVLLPVDGAEVDHADLRRGGGEVANVDQQFGSDDRGGR